MREQWRRAADRRQGSSCWRVGTSSNINITSTPWRLDGGLGSPTPADLHACRRAIRAPPAASRALAASNQNSKLTLAGPT